MACHVFQKNDVQFEIHSKQGPSTPAGTLTGYTLHNHSPHQHAVQIQTAPKFISRSLSPPEQAAKTRTDEHMMN